MKKSLLFLMLAAVMVLAGCSKKKEVTVRNYVNACSYAEPNKEAYVVEEFEGGEVIKGRVDDDWVEYTTDWGDTAYIPTSKVNVPKSFFRKVWDGIVGTFFIGLIILWVMSRKGRGGGGTPSRGIHLKKDGTRDLRYKD